MPLKTNVGINRKVTDSNFGSRGASVSLEVELDSSLVQPNPMNRWTSYESPNKEDWLEIDFGKTQEIGRVVLHLYDDRGGVQPPQDYNIEI